MKIVAKYSSLVVLALLICNNLFSQSKSHIKTFPFYEGFESSGKYYTLSKNTLSHINIDSLAVNTGIKGLIFYGSNYSKGWVDSAGYTTPLNAWKANFQNIATFSFDVDASLISSLLLKFDLKQTFKDSPRDCWFRVLVNGKQIKDIHGVRNFNPLSAQDLFRKMTFDLKVYTVGKLNITFQACCKSNRDCVMIDNVSLDNPDNVSIIDNDTY